jgi:hypothetical protein
MAATNKDAPRAAQEPDVELTEHPIAGKLTPARCRRYVRWRISERLGDVCDGLLDKAKEGDLAAVKVLFQMAELDGTTAKGAGSNDSGTRHPLRKQMAFVRKTLCGVSARASR